jgi:DNA-binding GntR family transcriptional regulator
MATENLVLELSQPRPASSLTDWVAEAVREAILDGQLLPGQKLDQDALAEELQVSRTPVREATRKLESEGLLEVRTHYGVFVKKVSKKDIADVFGVRAVLEAEVARQATTLIPEQVLDRLETRLEEAQKAYETGNTDAQFEADVCFHQTLREFTRNDLLREVLDGLANRIQAVRRFAQTKPGSHVYEFSQEHFDILHAMRRRDPERAAQLMSEHLVKSSVRVQQLMDEEDYH